MLNTLVILFLGFFILSFGLSDGDIFSPPVLVTMGFLASGIFASFLRGASWSGNIREVTIFTYIIGISLFLVGYYTFYGLSNKRAINYSPQFISIKKYNIYVYIIFSILATILYFWAIVRAVGTAGGWSGIMMRYRIGTLYAEVNGVSRIQIPGIISTLRMIVQAGGYVFVYILANNMVVEPKRNYKDLWLATGVSLFSTATTAQRLDLIRVPVAFMAIYFILKKKSGLLNRRKSLRLYLKYIIIAFVFLEIFANLKGIFGRTSSSDNAIEYVARYIGGPIPLLDSYLRNPITHSDLFGEETFWGIYDLLYKITGNRKFNYTYTLEFRSVEGIKIGNVYSAFRMYYADFGMVGVALFSLALGIIFGILYKKIIRSGNNHKRARLRIQNRYLSTSIDFKLLIYSVILHSCLLLFYQDWFFAHILTWYQIKMFIFMWFFMIVFVGQNKKRMVASI